MNFLKLRCHWVDSVLGAGRDLTVSGQSFNREGCELAFCHYKQVSYLGGKEDYLTKRKGFPGSQSWRVQSWSMGPVASGLWWVSLSRWWVLGEPSHAPLELGNERGTGRGGGCISLLGTSPLKDHPPLKGHTTFWGCHLGDEALSTWTFGGQSASSLEQALSHSMWWHILGHPLVWKGTCWCFHPLWCLGTNLTQFIER